MEQPPVYIKAINPGYTVDGASNAGEFIELARDPKTDTPISLANLFIGYTNSSGKTIHLLEFPEDSWMVGESILLRLSSSPERELAHLTYLKTLAMKAGPLELVWNGTTIDAVCWNGEEGCLAAFKSSTPTTLVRDDETLEFSHIETYEPIFSEENYYEAPEAEIKKQCESLEFSEILSYYESDQSEQFIEIYNPTAESILLDGCRLQYRNKTYPLTGTIAADGYFLYFPVDFSLTKDPATQNTIELIDADATIADTLTYTSGQKKSTSFAKIGYDASGQPIWKNTYAKTPGEANYYQQYKTCEAGKVINADTGNCVKIATVEEVVKTCDEGYELNEETGRCRKIRTNTGAEYEVIKNEVYTKETSFTALYAIIAIVILGVGYVIFQFRTELGRLFGKVYQQVQRTLRHVLGRHEH